MKVCLLVSIFLLISCKEKFTYVSQNDITEVVESILQFDSISLGKKGDSIQFKNWKPVQSSLIKTNVYPEKYFNEDKIYNPNTEIRISSLLKITTNGKKIFTSKDSMYLLAQNDTLKNVEIFNDLKDEYLVSRRKNISEDDNYSYYELSIPIFSKNKNNCYIQLNPNERCNLGYFFILEKINNKWTVIDKRYKILKNYR